MNYVDLHTHSTASDGTLSPGEVVRLAASEDLKAVALTDHDTVDGISRARAAAASLDIELIPGIELSCGQRSISWDFLPMRPAPDFWRVWPASAGSGIPATRIC
jgi:predicted metal-dependent phosphoesterase TrpH